MKYFFILTFLGFTGGFTNWFYWYDIPIPPFGNAIVTLYLSLMAYAIIKHHLLDIDLVIRKGLIYSILVTIITMVYLLLVLLMETLFRGFMGYKSVPWTVLIIVVFALLFQPLKNKVQHLVDKIFFKRPFEEIGRENIRLREELQRSEKLKTVGTLAAGMAHEIKNPLTSIKTFTEYLPKKYKDKNFIEKFQKIVGSEVDKINDIVGQLLNFAKPKSLELKDCNLKSLIDEILEFLSNEFIKCKIDIVKSYRVLNPILKIDPVQIKQVILNIILNSLDAMKDKSGQVKILIENDDSGNNIKIGIEDTGCGIDQKDLPHLFDPFYSTKDANTGLGLSIVHGIIEKHHGRVEVNSELNKGTNFTLYLPKT
jgi:signal transduction histidine kinase